MNQLLTIDFETYMDSESGYSLKKMSMAEYILDPRFKAHGLAVRTVNDPQNVTCWMSGELMERWIKAEEWGNVTLISQNAKFEASILHWIYGVKPARIVDTMALSMAHWGNTVPSHNLASIAERLGLPQKGELAFDGVRDLTPEQEAQIASYCRLDVDIACGIYEKLAPLFPESQWDILDWTIKIFIERAFEMDTERMAQAAIMLQKDKAEVINKTGQPIEVFRSQPKFVELLASKGYSLPTKKNKKGKVIPALSNQDAAFVRMREEASGELADLLAARKVAKQTLEIKRAQKASRLSRYSFDLMFSGAMQSHRFSGSNGFSGNPQQMPKKGELRKAIRAPKGYTILDGDFTAIEPHILAFISGDRKMTTAYRNKESLYCLFGTDFFGRQIVKDDSLEYKGSKAAVLGFGYGMGETKAMATAKTQFGLEWDMPTASKFKKAYRESFPAVPAFWQRCEVVLEIMSTQKAGSEVPFPGFPLLGIGKAYIVLPSGLKMRYWNLRKEWEVNAWGKKRPQWYFDRYDKKTLLKTRIWGGQLTENLCQALAGEVCKEAIWRLRQDGIPPAGQIHDELLVLCPESDVQAVEKQMYEAMTTAMPWWPELILEAELCSGPSWGEC